MGNETFLPNNRGEIKVYFFSLVYVITNHYLCKSEITQNQFACRIFVSRFLIQRGSNINKNLLINVTSYQIIKTNKLQPLDLSLTFHNTSSTLGHIS